MINGNSRSSISCNENLEEVAICPFTVGATQNNTRYLQYWIGKIMGNSDGYGHGRYLLYTSGVLQLQPQCTKFGKHCCVVATEDEREQYEDTPLRTSSGNVISINGFQEMIGLVRGKQTLCWRLVHGCSLNLTLSCAQRHPVVGDVPDDFPDVSVRWQISNVVLPVDVLDYWNTRYFYQVLSVPG